MQFSLEQFIDPDLNVFVEETKKLNAAKALSNVQSKQDLTDPKILENIRIERNKSIRSPDRVITKRNVEYDKRKVSIRIIVPKKIKAVGIFLEIHGGGFYLDSAARSDVSNCRLADALGLIVVSVDYSLAPENPWPAATDDCATVAFWLVKNSKSEFGVEKLFIGGASAGATLAVTTMLRLKKKKCLKVFSGAVLQYGAYDLSGMTPSGRLIKNEYFIQAYVGKIKDRTLPDISPLYGNLTGLPPVLILVGSLDILLEDNLAMSARLAAVGNSVNLRVYPESEHGFISRPTQMSDAAIKDIYEWLTTLIIR